MEHARLQVERLFRYPARRACRNRPRPSRRTGKVLPNAAASGFARRNASRVASSTIRNGKPTEAICGRMAIGF